MIPLLALGSAVDSSLHPRFLIHYDTEANENSALLGNPDPDEEGEPITRAELDRILTGDADQESLDSGQQNAILGDDSGLGKWGKGKISVYNEGRRLLICDEEGEYRYGAADEKVMCLYARFQSRYTSCVRRTGDARRSHGDQVRRMMTTKSLFRQVLLGLLDFLSHPCL
jgi:hypothetical protein